MQKTAVEINGELIQAVFEVVGSRLWIHARGQTWNVELRAAKKSTGRVASGAVANGEIRAPMPGKILKIMVREGDQVAPNQAVVAMEAMKMEYTLKSGVQGVVKKIHCREGQQVVLDEHLVSIEADSSKADGVKP